MKPSPQLTPAWETAITRWAAWLQEGRTASTVRLRGVHMRTVAALSRTATPKRATAEGLAAVIARQDWHHDYRCDVCTSVRSFCEWAGIT